MKKIPKIDLPGMTELSPLDMNNIHINVGLHSEIPASDNKN